MGKNGGRGRWGGDSRKLGGKKNRMLSVVGKGKGMAKDLIELDMRKGEGLKITYSRHGLLNKECEQKNNWEKKGGRNVKKSYSKKHMKVH